MHILNIIGLILSSYTVAVISSGGQSNVFHAQDGQGNYDFAYDITDPWGATNFREESGAFDPWGGSVVGSYGLADIDGRKRIVQYSADKNGFVAYIKTNEPGTSDEDAADAYYNGVDWNSGKWLYDFSIKHDKGWGKSDKGWGKSSDKGWGKSDKGGKKKDYGWSASARHEVNSNSPLKGQIFLDPRTRELYEAIDETHVIPLGKKA